MTSALQSMWCPPTGKVSTNHQFPTEEEDADDNVDCVSFVSSSLDTLEINSSSEETMKFAVSTRTVKNSAALRWVHHRPGVWIARLRFLTWSLPILLVDVMALLLFAFFLSPGFARFMHYYWNVSQRQFVQYRNESCRQTLDVYANVNTSASLDKNKRTMKQRRPPVVVFFPGGAWMIGYKLWGALLARSLNASGIIVVIADYRNYPWGCVPEMVQDVDTVLQWTLDHIHEYGGDPENIVVVGESAGGHLAFTALFRRAMEGSTASKVSSNSNSPPSPASVIDAAAATPFFAATQFKGLVALSSPFNLTAMEDTLVRHGLEAYLVDRIFGGQGERYNPFRLVQECNRAGISLAGAMPPVRMFHGSQDRTVPHDVSVAFSRELKLAGVKAKFVSYPGWSHTRANVEGPIDADYSFHRDVVQAVQEWTEQPADTPVRFPEDVATVLPRLCPHWLVQLGRFFMPV